MQSLNVAVVGATGAVGEALRSILVQRDFPVDAIRLLASARSRGKRFDFDGKTVRVEVLDEFDFEDTQIAFFSAGGSISAEHAPRAAEAGAIVVDNTSKFRYEDHIPLVVPEVNSHQVQNGLEPGIIANPNCSTIQMVVALKPIYDAVGIERINVATYQAVSGAGASGIVELREQVDALGRNEAPVPSVHPTQIAFNAVPQINVFEENGYTTEEMKMVWETKKIFEDDSIRVNPTCVRIPVVFGHSEAIHIETTDKISAADARRLLKNAPNVILKDEPKPGGYPTAAIEGDGTDAVYVGRVREDISHERGLNMWVVADNVRKGAALNAIQIAEEVRDLL